MTRSPRRPAPLSGLARLLRRARRTQSGSATIEFVMIFPFMVVAILSSFELGMITLRQVMLDRGLDLAVREIRLGTLAPVTHETVSAAICANALLMPNCARDLRLEMRPLDPRAWTAPQLDADCVDRADATVPLRRFTAGVENQLMLLRACSLFDPYFPSTGIGATLPRQSGGAYALAATSVFVIEP